MEIKGVKRIKSDSYTPTFEVTAVLSDYAGNQRDCGFNWIKTAYFWLYFEGLPRNGGYNFANVGCEGFPLIVVAIPSGSLCATGATGTIALNPLVETP